MATRASLITLACCLLVAGFSCGTALAADQGAQVSVTTAAAQVQNIPSQIEATGTIQAAEHAVLAAKVAGVVSKVSVTLGSTVQRGDVLVTINAGEINAKVSQAQAQLAQAQRNLGREQRLLAQNASTRETVKTMQDQYNIAQAGYNEARSMLSYTTITAPFAGVVTRKDVHAGDLATPGKPLLSLENNQGLQVRAEVPENLVLSLHKGDQLQVRVDAAGASIAGTISEIAPAADPASRTATVVLNLPGQPELRTGQFARVLLPDAGQQGLLVPVSALVPFGQMERVFVIDNGKAHLRLVRTGQQHQGMVEILSGLTAGETVAITNNRLLEDGQQVRVTP